MKIVINDCFGGFGLSNRAIERVAELLGRKAYFFEHGLRGSYIPVSADRDGVFIVAFDIPNPSDDMSNDEYHLHSIPDFEDDRSNPILVQVVEELGDAANGSYAELKIVEVPNDIKWHIEEYDGSEHVAEDHRTWH